MLPANVTGELDLTQSLTGPADNGTAATRGYASLPNYNMPFISNGSQVVLPMPMPPTSAPPPNSGSPSAAGGRHLLL